MTNDMLREPRPFSQPISVFKLPKGLLRRPKEARTDNTSQRDGWESRLPGLSSNTIEVETKKEQPGCKEPGLRGSLGGFPKMLEVASARLSAVQCYSLRSQQRVRYGDAHTATAPPPSVVIGLFVRPSVTIDQWKMS